MSNITQNEVASISSTASKIKFCEEEIPELLLYPGQKFIISLIALGQADTPVPTTVIWEITHKNREYRLSPSSSMVNDSCTRVSFWLYTSDLELRYLYFKLYPENPCHDLVEGLILHIHVLPCPVGFNLSPADSKYVCAMALKKLHEYTKLLHRW